MFVLPRYITVRSSHEISNLIDQLWGYPDQGILLDANHSQFVDPFGLCTLAANFHRLKLDHGKIIELARSGTIGSYLERMGVFTDGAVTGQNHTVSGNPNLMEVHCISAQAEVERVAARIVDTLMGCIGDVPPDPEGMVDPAAQLSSNLRYVFTELLDNALTHGRRGGFGNARAWVAAQSYPSNGKVRLAIVDTGCGFLTSLANHPELYEHTHEAAINLALQPRISCNRDLIVRPDESTNQGVGLTVVKDITVGCQGQIHIFSGDREFRYTGSSININETPQNWQGVSLAIEFRRDALQVLDVSAIIRSLPYEEEDVEIRFE